jgi:hypothetical protein
VVGVYLLAERYLVAGITADIAEIDE